MASQDKGVNQNTESKLQIDRNKSDEGKEFPPILFHKQWHLIAFHVFTRTALNLVSE